MDIGSGFRGRKTILSFLLSFLIIYLLMSRVDVGETLAVMRRADIRLFFLAFLIMYVDVYLRTLRWNRLLKNMGISAGIGKVFEILFISWFVNCVVPAKLGDLYRGYLVKKTVGEPISKVMGTIFMERVIDLISIVILVGASAILIFRGDIPTDIMSTIQVGFLVILIVVAALLVMRTQGRLFERFLPEDIHEVYRGFWRGTKDSVNRESVLYFFTSTAIIWVLSGVRYYFVLMSVSIDISFGAVLFIALTGAVLTAVPFTPAGLGAVEAGTAGLLILFGVDKELAVAAVLLDRLISYWSFVILGGLVYGRSTRV